MIRRQYETVSEYKVPLLCRLLFPVQPFTHDIIPPLVVLGPSVHGFDSPSFHARALDSETSPANT